MNKLLILSLLISSVAFAGGNVVEGKKKVEQVCQSCHGADGQGINDTYPKLAGQFQSYMEQTLKDYRSGKRTNAIMSGFASSLSDDDIKNVALYYATLKENRLHDLSIK